MKRADFLDLLDETFERLVTLTQTKGHEYANSHDQLANFLRLGQALGMPPEAVLLVYLTKHLDSIHNYVRELPEPAPSEAITGRIDDAILYLVLLKALIIAHE